MEDSKIIRDNAEKEADNIIREAEERADELTSEHSIVARAEQEGEKIRSEAERYRDNLCDSTHRYVINVLNDMENKVGNTMEALRQTYDDVCANKENFVNYVDKNNGQ